MVDQASDSLFLQDNLLSEDDWGGVLNLVDLNYLTSGDSNSPKNDFFIDKEAQYQSDYSSPSNFSEDNNLGFGQQHDISPSHSLPTQSNSDFFDDILQDLLQTKPSQQSNISDDVLLQQAASDSLGERRHSTNTSSSSAYSSCSDSGTPSPAEQFSDHGSCSSGEFHDRETIDLTSISDNELCHTATYSNILESHKQKNNLSQIKTASMTKSKQYNKPCRTSNIREETDLDRAVRLACEETNRLLGLHRSLSSKNAKNTVDCDAIKKAETKKTETKEKDILKSLCEETILGKSSSIVLKHSRKTNESSTKTGNSKPLKRKASGLQNAIDRLQSANKTLCLSTLGSTKSVSHHQSVEAVSRTGSILLDSAQQVAKERCIIVTQPQQPVTQKITLEGVNGSQTYTLTPTSPPPSTPVQFYIKQETPAFQPCSMLGSYVQSSSNQNTFSNQKVYVSTGTSSNVTLSNSSTNISIVKPEQLLCGNGGQTIVIQQPTQTTQQQSIIKPVTISDMKPGSDPVVLSQSDLSRLAAQGVIKFPANKKTERNLIPVTQEARMQIKNEPKQTPQPVRKPTIIPTVCDVLPNDAAGIINGTSVFVNNGATNQPQRGELDLKALKRHQRMIKNRASACESRQRRKEYLKTLEDQVTEVAEENKILREQNDFLVLRVKELEIENDNLRKVIGIKQLNQKKAACLLMLVLFVGITFFPVGLFGNNSPFQSGDMSLNADYVNTNGLVVPGSTQNSFRTGRHLLSFFNNNDDASTNSQAQNAKNNNKLMIPERQSYWMDDLVQEYKDKHLQRFLQLLSETTSNSVKRMLRRKLKEELGISIPLPVPRNRRIAYTPRVTRQRIERTVVPRDPRPSDRKVPSSVTVDKSDVKMPTSLPQPCEKPSHDDSALNETETTRVNNDLTEWAFRYTVERQEKEQKKAEKKKTAKKPRNTKSPSSRYEEYENKTSTNEIALYSRPNKKFDDFLDAINRKNDTFYIVSLNRDHLLLPASIQNTSSRMKMALVMPAITTKERSAHGHITDEYETMIHIECEVVNTRMFDLKRKDVPDFLNVNPSKTAFKTLENTSSNDTISNDGNSTKITKKEKRVKHQKELRQSNRGEVNSLEDQQRNQEEDAVVSDVADVDFGKLN